MISYILQAAEMPASGLSIFEILIILGVIIFTVLIIRHRKNRKSDKLYKVEKNTYDVNRQYKCFIAGSISLQTERDAIRAVLSEIHNRWASKNIYVTSYTFEDFETNIQRGGLQNLYDTFISGEADCVVFIVDGEIGSKTLHEFNVALNSYNIRSKPSIYVYNRTDGKPHPQSEAFINKVMHVSHYWRPYRDIADLKLKFKEDITNELIGTFV